MPLYTFIADYEGGIYASQVTAPDPKSAIFAWAQNLEVEAIPNVGEKSRQKLIHALHQDEENETLHVLLNGLINVWCFDAFMRGKFMTINFVETCSTARF